MPLEEPLWRQSKKPTNELKNLVNKRWGNLPLLYFLKISAQKDFHNIYFFDKIEDSKKEMS